MKLTVICQTCGKKLSVVEKDQISQEDINMYTNNSTCPEDDTYEDVPALDENGDPVLDGEGNPTMKTIRYSNIVAVKSQD